MLQMNLKNPYIGLHLFVISLMMLPSLCTGQNAGGPILDEGILQMQKGNYSNAVAFFSKVLRQYPDNYLANLSTGVSLREMGRLDSALSYFDKAIRIDPKDPGGYVNRGMLFYKRNEYVKGDLDERKAMLLQPDLATPYEILGYSLLERKKYNEAYANFDAVISRDKNSYKAYVNKAAALGKLARHEEAIAVLNQVIELKPDYITAYYNRAYAYLYSGDMDHAFADCNKILEIDNKNIDGLLLRAGLKDQAGDDPGAIEDCNKAIAIDPNNPKAYNQRAISRFDLHDHEGIISDCTKAIELQPDYYDALVQRGDAYDDLNNYNKALEDYDKAIALEPGKLIAYREGAGAQAHKNDYKASLNYLEKGLLIEPGNKYLLEHKFRIQLILGDHKGALSTLDQCIKFYQDSSMIYYMQKTYLYDSLNDKVNACKNAFEALKRGLTDGYEYLNTHHCAAYKQNPRFLVQPLLEEAQKENAAQMYVSEIATLSKAIALLPDSSSLYYNRGAAERKLNNFEKAIADYNRAIGLRPKFPEAIVSRAVAKAYLNDIEGALKDYRLAFKADSTYAIAYNNYASTIEETDIPGAIEYFTMAIHYNKKYASACLARGKLYAKLGKKEEACRDFSRAESLGSVDAKIERMVSCK